MAELSDAGCDDPSRLGREHPDGEHGLGICRATAAATDGGVAGGGVQSAASPVGGAIPHLCVFPFDPLAIRAGDFIDDRSGASLRVERDHRVFAAQHHPARPRLGTAGVGRVSDRRGVGVSRSTAGSGCRAAVMSGSVTTTVRANCRGTSTRSASIFAGEYGQGRLDVPLFPDTTQTSFDTIVLRAGNERSPRIRT